MDIYLPPLPDTYPKKLIIPNPTAADLGTALGLSQERQNELSECLNQMVRKFGSSNVRTCNVLDEIAGYCNSWEETIWATVLHIGWHARRGTILF